jgi:hypothetical protein
MLIVLALVGAAVGFGVVRLGGLGPKEFRGTGEFRLWLFLIATQTAIWAIGAVILPSPRVLDTLGGLWSQGRPIRTALKTDNRIMPSRGVEARPALRAFLDREGLRDGVPPGQRRACACAACATAAICGSC